MHEEKHSRLKQAALTAKGDTAPSIRERIFAAVEAQTKGKADDPGSFPAPLTGYLKKLAGRAAEIEDEDIEALRAESYSDDALFEITVTGAVAAGLTRYALAMKALEESR